MQSRSQWRMNWLMNIKRIVLTLWTALTLPFYSYTVYLLDYFIPRSRCPMLSPCCQSSGKKCLCQICNQRQINSSRANFMQRCNQWRMNWFMNIKRTVLTLWLYSYTVYLHDYFIPRSHFPMFSPCCHSSRIKKLFQICNQHQINWFMNIGEGAPLLQCCNIALQHSILIILTQFCCASKQM